MERIRIRLRTSGFGDFGLPSGQSTPVCYRFELTGRLISSYDLMVENGRARLEATGATSPQVLLRCAMDIFVLMMYRRLPLEVAIADNALAVEELKRLLVMPSK